MNTCFTPGSLVVKERVKETPKSTRGSSMFSPGEAFWDEAIQLADGLCAPRTCNSFEAGEHNNVAEDQVFEKSSCNLQNNEGKSSKILHQSQRRGENLERGTPLGLVGVHGKDSVKEGFGLPVKHFDFSFEDTNLDENSPQQRGAGNLVSITHEAHRQYEVGSVNSKSVNFTKNSSAVSTNADKTMNEVQEKASVYVRKKINSSSVHDDILTSNTARAHSSDESGTPSSNMLLNGRLDLNRWLPPEICSIYRKKGISKLYDWQVCL